jgi:hypothetical protein
MNKDQAKGRVKEVEGKVKEVAGKLTVDKIWSKKERFRMPPAKCKLGMTI